MMLMTLNDVQGIASPKESRLLYPHERRRKDHLEAVYPRLPSSSGLSSDDESSRESF